MTTRLRIIRSTALLFAALLAVGSAVTSSPQASSAANSYTAITGTGSTWSQNALDQWRKNVASNYGMTVNYSGTGSSAGRGDFIKGTVDFAVSEIAFDPKPTDGSTAEVAKNFAYMPIVAGGTSFMYNLKIGGKRVTNLRLSGETVTKIFTGVITNWKDPQIVADNPGLAMPDKPIVPVVRSDGSGSTAQFTLWMSKQFPALWKSFSALTGKTSQFPAKGAMKAQNGSLGVAGYVSQNYGEGAITYVEYSYALKSGFPVAKVLNSAGYYVEPKATAVAVALMKATIDTNPGPDYLTQILDGVYNSADPRTYPLSSYSYMIVPTKIEAPSIFTTDKGNTLGVFARYMICDGQKQAAALGYSPLPMNLVLAGFKQIARIPGAGNVDVNPDACKNPTFKAGDKPENNQLALTAPQPPACDKQGPQQCTAGTGGAAGVETTPSGGGSKGGTTAGTETTDTASDAGGAPLDDSASGPASSGEAAVSSPFTLAGSSFGAPQYLMIGAGLFLLFAILLPPFLSKRLRRSKSDTAG